MWARTSCSETGMFLPIRASRNIRSTGYSLEYAIPPRVWNAWSAASHEACDAVSLATFGLAAARPSLVEEPGGLVGHQPGQLGLGLDLGQRELDRLVGADRPAEDLALPGVRRGDVEGGVR